jgi:hypothetical protein
MMLIVHFIKCIGNAVDFWQHIQSAAELIPEFLDRHAIDSAVILCQLL